MGLRMRGRRRRACMRVRRARRARRARLARRARWFRAVVQGSGSHALPGQRCIVFVQKFKCAKRNGYTHASGFTHAPFSSFLSSSPTHRPINGVPLFLSHPQARSDPLQLQTPKRPSHPQARPSEEDAVQRADLQPSACGAGAALPTGRARGEGAPCVGYFKVEGFRRTHPRLPQSRLCPPPTGLAEDVHPQRGS